MIKLFTFLILFLTQAVSARVNCNENYSDCFKNIPSKIIESYSEKEYQGKNLVNLKLRSMPIVSTEKNVMAVINKNSNLKIVSFFKLKDTDELSLPIKRWYLVEHNNQLGFVAAKFVNKIIEYEILRFRSDDSKNWLDDRNNNHVYINIKLQREKGEQIWKVILYYYDPAVGYKEIQYEGLKYDSKLINISSQDNFIIEFLTEDKLFLFSNVKIFKGVYNKY